MKDAIKKYKELILTLFPMCLLGLDWYQSFRVADENLSVQLPYHGYEFLFHSRGLFLIIYLLCTMLQIVSIKYEKLRICAILGHLAYSYCLFVFPAIFIGTFIQDFYAFYRTGAYVSLICESLAIILNIAEMIVSKKRGNK